MRRAMLWVDKVCLRERLIYLFGERKRRSIENYDFRILTCSLNVF